MFIHGPDIKGNPSLLVQESDDQSPAHQGRGDTMCSDACQHHSLYSLRAEGAFASKYDLQCCKYLLFMKVLRSPGQP